MKETPQLKILARAETQTQTIQPRLIALQPYKGTYLVLDTNIFLVKKQLRYNLFFLSKQALRSNTKERKEKTKSRALQRQVIRVSN